MPYSRAIGEGRAFCAGRDIAGVTPEDDDAKAYLSGLVEPLLKKMAAFPAPTFAAAHGACLGVGLGLLLATDVVYVAENAKFGSPFAKLGATLDSGGHWYFTERLGMHRTLDLIYTADLISGAEAVAQGMFSRVMPDDDLLTATRIIVERVAAGATGAFTASTEKWSSAPGTSLRSVFYGADFSVGGCPGLRFVSVPDGNQLGGRCGRH